MSDTLFYFDASVGSVSFENSLDSTAEATESCSESYCIALFIGDEVTHPEM